MERKTYDIFGYKWIGSQEWGLYHPDNLSHWYDESQIKIYDKHQFLELGCEKNPKNFKSVGVIPIGIGIVETIDSPDNPDFRYGVYEADIKMADSPYMWGGFWIYPHGHWSAEIDIVESYSNKRGSYFKPKLSPKLPFFSLYNNQTNIHYDTNDDLSCDKHIKGRVGFSANPSKNFINYKVSWFKDSIRIYYDDILVREITDKEVLKPFKNERMRVLFSNFTQKEKNPNDKYSRMLVKNFKYTPYV